MMLGRGGEAYTPYPLACRWTILLPACVQVNAMLQALQDEDAQILTANETAQEGAGQAEQDPLPDEVDPQVGAVRAHPQ